MCRILSEQDNTDLGIRRRSKFEHARDMIGGAGRPFLVKESIFQLVPGVSSSACSGVRQAVWRHGYWHIARSQVHCGIVCDAYGCMVQKLC